jgi:hypothetical protein
MNGSWIDSSTTYNSADEYDTNGFKWNIGIIDTDNITNAADYFQPIQTGMLLLNSKDV